MKAKLFIVSWVILVLGILFYAGGIVYRLDPFFHYHKPLTEEYYYILDNQRSQNDGIVKHFDYNALITGTSMTEGFKTSDMDAIFGVKSVKVPFSGGSYKEINDIIAVALDNNPNLKTVVRGLDYMMICNDKDRMRYELGEYPTYLYDNNIFNDVKYLLNKDVIFGRGYSMLVGKRSEVAPGITSFDDYSSWDNLDISYGKNSIIKDGLSVDNELIHEGLSEEQQKLVEGNVEYNIVDTAEKNPDVDFYYFFTPYSAVWWGETINEKSFFTYIDSEKEAIERMLEQKNIYLYSFNDMDELTTDLNNYKDHIHYGPWINSKILQWIKEGTGLLTKENYDEYIEREMELYTSFDYSTLSEQEDYEDDSKAAENWGF